MQALDLPNGYRLTVLEMSRKSQLAISTWFNGWFAGGGSDLTKLQSVSEISTQVILHSRLSLSLDGVKVPDGAYAIEEGMTITLPMTEDCLNNDLPASLVVWLIDAAGRENATVLNGFLAGVRTVTRRGQMTSARLFASGPSSSLTQD